MGLNDFDHMKGNNNLCAYLIQIRLNCLKNRTIITFLQPKNWYIERNLFNHATHSKNLFLDSDRFGHVLPVGHLTALSRHVPLHPYLLRVHDPGTENSRSTQRLDHGI
jgi:hypothetical protein